MKALALAVTSLALVVSLKPSTASATPTRDCRDLFAFRATLTYNARVAGAANTAPSYNVRSNAPTTRALPRPVAPAPVTAPVRASSEASRVANDAPRAANDNVRVTALTPMAPTTPGRTRAPRTATAPANSSAARSERVAPAAPRARTTRRRRTQRLTSDEVRILRAKSAARAARAEAADAAPSAASTVTPAADTPAPRHRRRGGFDLTLFEIELRRLETARDFEDPPRTTEERVALAAHIFRMADRSGTGALSVETWLQKAKPRQIQALANRIGNLGTNERMTERRAQALFLTVQDLIVPNPLTLPRLLTFRSGHITDGLRLRHATHELLFNPYLIALRNLGLLSNPTIADNVSAVIRRYPNTIQAVNSIALNGFVMAMGGLPGYSPMFNAMRRQVIPRESRELLKRTPIGEWQPILRPLFGNHPRFHTALYFASHIGASAMMGLFLASAYPPMFNYLVPSGYLNSDDSAAEAALRIIQYYSLSLNSLHLDWVQSLQQRLGPQAPAQDGARAALAPDAFTPIAQPGSDAPAATDESLAGASSENPQPSTEAYAPSEATAPPASADSPASPPSADAAPPSESAPVLESPAAAPPDSTDSSDASGRALSF